LREAIPYHARGATGETGGRSGQQMTTVHHDASWIPNVAPIIGQ